MASWPLSTAFMAAPRTRRRARVELRLRSLGLVARSGARTSAEAIASWRRRRAPRRREWIGRVVASLVGILCAWVSVEAVLRMGWIPLPPQLGAALLSCYDPHDTYHGVYFQEPRLGVNLFK